MQAFDFLFKKMKSVPFKSILTMEFEGWMQFAFGSLPGIVGFLCRNTLLTLLCSEKKGFIWIQPRVTLANTNQLKVGKNVGINTGSYINAVGGITMCDYVLIGSNVTISSGIHPIDGHHPTVYERPVIPKPIFIGEGAWIGAGSVIMPGVNIGTGSIIGANSIVTKDTEPFGVYVGAPARKIKTR